MHYVRWQRHGNPLTTVREMHGLSNTSEYKIWEGMVGRCHNKAHTKYAYYGGRGITVCDRWRTSFVTFYEDMGPRPTKLTIDRINNNGNYEPGNCRWATRSTQSFNQRLKSTNTSGITGVWWHNQVKKWAAEIMFHGKKTSLGCYPTIEEAAEARHNAEIKYYG